MNLSNKKIIFWDFDGVIKDSLDVKKKAFEELFQAYGDELVNKISAHHTMNGGVSRFEKIPLYLKWANLPIDERQKDLFCQKFSEIVFEGVVNSPWVPGIREYLLDNKDHCYFVLVTATPQDEIRSILQHTGILDCFREVHGSPRQKKDVLASTLKKLQVKAIDALMIGDSEVDLFAAQANAVPFLLRQTSNNKGLQNSFKGPQFKSLMI